MTWEYKNCFHFPPGVFVSKIKNTSTYEELSFHYSQISWKQNLDLHGYFQSEKYFKDFEAEIKRIFKIKNHADFRSDVASIHVRRTDYLNFPNHHPCMTMQYYERAMELVGVNKFIVFSDDMAWCKQHFLGNAFEFSEGNDTITDLAIQMNCAHNIIANSTYSWWAAWLNPNQHKKVIAPEKWFGPALSGHNTKDLIPDSWIKT